MIICIFIENDKNICFDGYGRMFNKHYKVVDESLEHFLFHDFYHERQFVEDN